MHLLLIFVIVGVVSSWSLKTADSFHIRSQLAVPTRKINGVMLHMSTPDGPKEKKKRVVRYDNVGDPIFEGDDSAKGNSISPVSVTALIFGLIAFNFFVLANADIPQFNINNIF